MGEEEEGGADEDEDEEDRVPRVAVDEGGEGDRHRFCALRLLADGDGGGSDGGKGLINEERRGLGREGYIRD